MVYDEADKAHLIVTKTVIKQFQEMADDDPNKEFLADKIVKNPNVPQEIKNEAVKHLQNVSILQDTIVKNGFGSGFDGLAEIQNIKDINLEFAKRLIKEANFSQRFNTAANVTDFLNHIYDSFIEGWKTGNWDKFRDDIAEYGQGMVLSIVVGYVVIAGLAAMAAAGVVGAEAALVALAVAGVAATLYGVYELYQKVRDTDFNELIDITKQNFKELFENNKDWLNKQYNDVIKGFADVLNQFTAWGEQGSLQPLLLAYKDTIEQSKGAIDFKYIKTQIEKDNQLAGTEEDDILSAKTSKKGVVAYGDKGADSIIGSQYQDILFGGEGNDRLYGEQANDTLIGGLGNDTLNGGEGNDTLIDESGNETYDFIGDFGHDTIYDQDGSGVIKINYLTLKATKKVTDGSWETSHQDYVITVSKTQENTEGYYSVYITSKSDITKSITISQWKQGDLGLNLTGLGEKAEQLDSTGYTLGTDDNNLIGGHQYVASYAGNDFVVTTINNDVVIAGAGNDVVNTGDGDDVVYAGVNEGSADDNDVVFTGEGSDKIYAGAGDDIIFSSSPMNGAYYDIINHLKTEEQQKADDKANLLAHQRAYSNLFFKNIKYDSLAEISHSPSYYFGDSYHLLPSVNSYYWATAKNNRPVNFFYNVYALTNHGESYAGADIVYAGVGNDVVVGSSDTDSLYGEQGNDALYGLSGNDLLDGGEGDDELVGGDGLDILVGGAGKDRISGGLEHDKLYGGVGNDVLNGDLSLLRNTGDYPTGTPFERFGDDYLDGGVGDDILVGNGGHDRLYGSEGDDKLQGDYKDLDGQYHGNDILDGGIGNDKLRGDGGNDTLYGGEGDDELQGDSSDLDGQYHGDDALDGGKGNDRL